MENKKEKKRKGRPSKLDGVVLESVARLYHIGLTDKDVSYALGISEVTLNAWKKKNPDFLKSIKKGKAVADARVEMKLYQRACGYSHQAVKIFCNKDGKVTEVPYIEHYPPDTTAAIFWKKNREPERWRDKQEVDLSGEITTRISYSKFKEKMKSRKGK